MKTRILVLLVALLTIGGATAQKWTNPLTLKGEWEKYGIGDPYILKYRGVYYLYCSTRDNATGVLCWASKDLIDWGESYMCSTDVITKGAYAPEVVYWNGKFYMYTSPAGNGHYVLTSDSPTGPFVRVTENFGKSIDGSVFIEDDGQWYFYYAGGGTGGIQGAAMTSPTSVGNGVNMGVTMLNDWTEGPTVIKRNGTYYIIYTGNHVISKGYRIDYAKNVTGPISAYTPQKAQNPIILNAEGPIVGLGHGSAFVGPDLDTYYYTYHNLAGDYGVGPYRRFNYDRIAWNGDKMVVLGATYWGQQAPEKADFVDFFDRTAIGTNWTLDAEWSIKNNDYLYRDGSNAATEYRALSKEATGDNYTAEFTIREEARGNDAAKLGAVFGYQDEKNYGIAVLRTKTSQLEVSFQVDGTWSTAKLYALPKAFNYAAWHTIRIEKSGTSYKFFVDGMQKATLKSTLGGGKVGYMTCWSKANFGYVAFSNRVNGSGIFDIYKPVPGTIEAVHYNTGGEGVGYHDLTEGNSGKKYIREDNVDISDCSEGGHIITAIQAGEWYTYNVNIRQTRSHNVGIRYASKGQASLKLWQDGKEVSGTVHLPATNGSLRTVIEKELRLTSGYHTLKVEAVSGEFDLYTLQFEEADNIAVTHSDNFDSGFGNWFYADGTWTTNAGQAYLSGYGKRSMGEAGWTDYAVEVDVTYTDSFNGGLLLRARNLALGANGKSAQAGSDFLQGYFITLGPTSVTLGKQNYNWTTLASGTGSYTLNKKYNLKATITGDNIKVYVDDKLVIDYTDPKPFISGRAGLRVHNANIYFDNFSVTVLKTIPSSVEKATLADEVNLYLTDEGILSLDNISGYTDLAIYALKGQLLHRSELPVGNETSIDMSGYTSGIYLVKLTDSDRTSVVKKFMKK